jgi:hypothetical protein
MGLRPQGAMIARLPKASIILPAFTRAWEGRRLFRLRFLRIIVRKAMRRGYSTEAGRLPTQ